MFFRQPYWELLVVPDEAPKLPPPRLKPPDPDVLLELDVELEEELDVELVPLPELIIFWSLIGS